MKEKKPACPCCRHPGFKLKPWTEEAPFKPIFECDKCRHQWSFGRDGGVYSHKVMNKNETKEILSKFKNFNSV